MRFFSFSLLIGAGAVLGHLYLYRLVRQVLLAHQPVGFEAAVERGMGLQISGHTHGGQLFPMTALVGFAYPYCRGLYRREDSHIYVSRGCGFWGPPARVGSPPEIVRYALTS